MQLCTDEKIFGNIKVSLFVSKDRLYHKFFSNSCYIGKGWSRHQTRCLSFIRATASDIDLEQHHTHIFNTHLVLAAGTLPVRVHWVHFIMALCQRQSLTLTRFSILL